MKALVPHPPVHQRPASAPPFKPLPASPKDLGRTAPTPSLLPPSLFSGPILLISLVKPHFPCPQSRLDGRMRNWWGSGRDGGDIARGCLRYDDNFLFREGGQQNVEKNTTFFLFISLKISPTPPFTIPYSPISMCDGGREISPDARIPLSSWAHTLTILKAIFLSLML